MSKDSLSIYEPAVKVAAATALSQSISFCLDRKYLDSIAEGQSDYSLSISPKTQKTPTSWIKIDQIGKPLEDSYESCFSAIQKVLYATHLPKKRNLLFLIESDGSESHLFIGINANEISNENSIKKEVVSLNEFLKGIWPGINAKVVKEDESQQLTALKRDLSLPYKKENNSLSKVVALTGIPSMESQYETIYPATIDKLIAGMQGKHFAYLIVATPINESEAEDILFQCRELSGRAESLKTINVTEGITNGTSDQVGTSKSFQSSWGKSNSQTSNTGQAISALVKAGIMMVNPGMMEFVTGDVGKLIDSTIVNLIGQQSSQTNENRSITNGTNESHGTNTSNSLSIGQSITNKHIEATSKYLAQHEERITTGKSIGLWTVGTYLMAENDKDLNSCALQLRSLLSGADSVFEPMRIHNITTLLDKEVPTSDLCKTILSHRSNSFGRLMGPAIGIKNKDGAGIIHPFGPHYSELKTVLTTKELSYLVNFPLRSVPGISVVDSSAEFSLNKLEESEKTSKFGKLINGGTTTNMDYNLSIDSLSKHTLLCGINGTGKTNTVQSILNSIDGKIPFLIIEPAKTEYVDWAIEYNKKHSDKPISIYIPGCKSYKDRRNNGEAVDLKQLKLNPFEPVWLEPEQDPNVLSHIDRLKSTFAAAFPMYDILPVLMEDLIYTLYNNKTTNWLTEDPKYGETNVPTLNGMKVYAEKVIHDCGYEKQVEANMKACMNTRIKSLLRGWKKDMLGCSKSTDWEELFEKPCVINLSYVGDDVDKAFFMALILQFMYEYRQALAETGKTDFNSNTCKHLTIIEEAHRVMMKCDNPDMPQYKSAMMFSNMLSEIRAYGEGMLLVDQVPTRLVPDAIKNTNTKICHRMVSEDDCRAIAESMGISDEQKKMIPKLLIGQCIVSTSLSTDKHWVQVNKVK